MTKYLNQNEGLRKYSIVNVNARKSPIKTSSIDVFANDTAFKYITNLEKVINELYRVMKPDGKAYSTIRTTPLTYCCILEK